MPRCGRSEVRVRVRIRVRVKVEFRVKVKFRVKVRVRGRVKVRSALDCCFLGVGVRRIVGCEALTLTLIRRIGGSLAVKPSP